MAGNAADQKKASLNRPMTTCTDIGDGKRLCITISLQECLKGPQSAPSKSKCSEPCETSKKKTRSGTGGESTQCEPSKSKCSEPCETSKKTGSGTADSGTGEGSPRASCEKGVTGRGSPSESSGTGGTGGSSQSASSKPKCSPSCAAYTKAGSGTGEGSPSASCGTGVTGGGSPSASCGTGVTGGGSPSASSGTDGTGGVSPRASCGTDGTGGGGSQSAPSKPTCSPSCEAYTKAGGGTGEGSPNASCGTGGTGGVSPRASCGTGGTGGVSPRASCGTGGTGGGSSQSAPSKPTCSPSCEAYTKAGSGTGGGSHSGSCGTGGNQGSGWASDGPLAGSQNLCVGTAGTGIGRQGRVCGTGVPGGGANMGVNHGMYNCGSMGPKRGYYGYSHGQGGMEGGNQCSIHGQGGTGGGHSASFGLCGAGGGHHGMSHGHGGTGGGNQGFSCGQGPGGTGGGNQGFICGQGGIGVGNQSYSHGPCTMVRTPVHCGTRGGNQGVSCETHGMGGVNQGFICEQGSTGGGNQSFGCGSSGTGGNQGFSSGSNGTGGNQGFSSGSGTVGRTERYCCEQGYTGGSNEGTNANQKTDVNQACCDSGGTGLGMPDYSCPPNKPEPEPKKSGLFTCGPPDRGSGFCPAKEKARAEERGAVGSGRGACGTQSVCGEVVIKTEKKGYGINDCGAARSGGFGTEASEGKPKGCSHINDTSKADISPANVGKSMLESSTHSAEHQTIPVLQEQLNPQVPSDNSKPLTLEQKLVNIHSETSYDDKHKTNEPKNELGSSSDPIVNFSSDQYETAYPQQASHVMEENNSFKKSQFVNDTPSLLEQGLSKLLDLVRSYNRPMTRGIQEPDIEKDHLPGCPFYDDDK